MNHMGTWHLVFGKLSIHIQDMELECHAICAECNSPEIGEVSFGDDGVTVCPDCQSIEQGYRYVSANELENL
jgi:hypothetical protein